MKGWFVILLIGVFAFNACQQKKGKEKQEKIVNPQFQEEDDSNLPLEERAKKQAIAKIGMPGNEKFTLGLFPAYLNDDNLSDAVITINRLENAKQNAAANPGSLSTLEKNGFVGNYNYFMIYDGASNQFSAPIPIPSSAARKLSIDFENLFSDEYVTAIITYRIKNTEFKNFYNVSDGIMDKIFKMISYDQAGTPQAKAYVYEVQNSGHFSTVKDLITYDAVLENSAEIGKDWFSSEAKLKKTDKIHKHWFYDPKRISYVTPDK